MDERTVLLISSHENGFTENAIVDGLKQAGVSVHNIAFGDASTNEMIDKATIVLIVAGTTLDIYSPIVSGVKQKCQDSKKCVALYGTINEIEQLKRIFPESLIAAIFTRPVTAEVMAGKLQSVMTKLDAQNRMKKILVVDDSGQMLRTIMHWLQDLYSVHVANSAATALGVMEKMTPDLILLDYEMPVCSGAQFFMQLRSNENTKYIPVVFLTARDDAETVKSVLALKPEGYLLKTSSEERVLKTIADVFSLN